MMDEARQQSNSLVRRMAVQDPIGAANEILRLDAAVSAAESRIQELEAHIGRLREALETIERLLNPPTDGEHEVDEDVAAEIARAALSSTPEVKT